MLTRPLGRIFMKGWLEGPEVRRVSSSGFLVTGTEGAGTVDEAAGIENPTTEDMGRAFGLDDAGPV